MEISKQKRAVRLAYKIGYRIRDSKIYNPLGGILKGGYKKTCYVAKLLYYHQFGIRISKGHLVEFPDEIICNPRCVNILVHLLVAYEKFGEELFKTNIQVRHIDGNSLNNNHENITLGTPQQNTMDRSRECRVSCAISASKHIRKLKTNHECVEFWKDKFNGMSNKELSKKWNLSSSTVYALLTRVQYMQDVKESLIAK